MPEQMGKIPLVDAILDLRPDDDFATRMGRRHALEALQLPELRTIYRRERHNAR